MYIVAKVGSNWRTFEDLKDSVQMAKTVGADCVKFQLFTHQELYGYAEETAPKWTQSPCMHPDWVPLLAQKAQAAGIGFMCTAFSPRSLELIIPYIAKIKIASNELTHLRLLEKARTLALAHGKEVVLSTGGSSDGDILMACKVLCGLPLRDPVPVGFLPDISLTLLYCVSSYPATWVNLDAIDYLRKEFSIFNVAVGFSDHTTDVLEIPLRALAHNAAYLEKHFTLDRITETDDSDHSLNPDKFKAMIERIRGQWTRPSRYNPTETAMFLMHNRRVVAIQDIEKNESLVEDVNFGVYRSKIEDTQGGLGFQVPKFVGRQVSRKIQCGSGISPFDLL